MSVDTSCIVILKDPLTVEAFDPDRDHQRVQEVHQGVFEIPAKTETLPSNRRGSIKHTHVRKTVHPSIASESTSELFTNNPQL